MSESRSKIAFQSFVNEIADYLAVWYRLIEHTESKDVPPEAFAYMSKHTQTPRHFTSYEHLTIMSPSSTEKI